MVFKRWLRSVQGLVGIDFGSAHLRALQVREAPEGLRVVAAAHLECGTDEEALPSRERLERMLALAGFRGRRCVVSLPRSLVRIQSVRMPVMPDAELVEAVSWEAAERFGLDRDAMESDFIRAGVTTQGGERREEIIMIAASHEVLMPRLELLMSAGMVPVAVDTGFGAVGRLFSRRHRRRADERDVRALVEVGESGSTMVLLRGGSIAYVKPLPLGGAVLSAAVAERLGIELEAATAMRRARMTAAERPGEEVDPTVQRVIFDAVRPHLSDLAREIALCLRYCGVTFRGEPPRQLVLTGPHAGEPGFAEMLRDGLRLEVSSDDAIGTVRSLSASLDARVRHDCGPIGSWVTAAGLSLRGVGRASAPASDAEPRAIAEVAV